MEEKRILQIFENAPRADVAAPRENKKENENPPNFKQPLKFGWE